jgi:hypothetical protein
MIEKLFCGVLRVMTPLGPRYLLPTFKQRLYLIWVFRNFPTLPVKVLTVRQLEFMESLWAQDQFVSFGMGVDDAPLVGTLEQRPPVTEQMPERKPARSVRDSVAPFAADARRQ